MRKCLFVLLVIASNATYAAANKWIDSEGHVHYTDQAPPRHAKSAETLKLSSPDTPIEPSASGVPAVSAVPATAKTAADKDPAAKKAAAEKAAQEAALKEQNKANCAGAKQNLANLQDGMRIAIIDPVTGERSYMEDDQRQKSMDEAKQQISKYCQ